MTDTFYMPLITLSLAVLLLTGIGVLRVKKDKSAFLIALAGSLVVLVLALYTGAILDFTNPALQFEEKLGNGFIAWHVGIDSINILFVLLVTLLTPLLLHCLHHTDEGLSRKQLAGILCYEGLLLAAVSTQNLFLFWCLLLLEIIPMRLLTGLWQSGIDTKKDHAARIITRYWLLMLAMLLAGMLVLVISDGTYPALATVLLFFGVAVRLPVFPFHGWLPVLVSKGNVMGIFCFIAGIKLGIYGLVRFVLPLVEDFSFWTGYIQVLGLLSIFYGALMALMQINLNRLLAFAVISQNGMLLIGLFTFNAFGLLGSILLSNAYGLAAIGMILSIGYIRSKTGTVSIPRLGNLFESNVFPALLFFLAALSTMAMPGTPGYSAAHLLLEGVIVESGWHMAIAILIGNVLAAAFLLRAFQQVFIADSRRHPAIASSGRKRQLPGEILASCTLCALLLLAGFAPLAELLRSTS